MRAITLSEPDAQPALREDLPTPTPNDNEVLVRVQASSVNPVDGSIAAGLLAQMGVDSQYPVRWCVSTRSCSAVGRPRPGPARQARTCS
jgi:NADPH:quinone reductase-like Zn-dependent oxidoreductase